MFDADEIGQDTGRAFLHAAGSPSGLHRQVAEASAAKGMSCAPDVFIETDHQLGIAALAEFGDGASLGRR